MRAEESLAKKYQTRYLISTQIPVHKILKNRENETVPTNVVSDKSGVVVQVNLSPQSIYQIQMTVMLFGSSKRMFKELADDLGSEIATMLSEAYENTPVTT